MIINFQSRDRFVFCQALMSTRDKSPFNAFISLLSINNSLRVHQQGEYL